MNHSSNPSASTFYKVKDACLVIGITSLAIFALNILALALTSNFSSVQWRVNFLEQVGNRSIALLFGFGLVLYGFSDKPKLCKRLAYLCLMAGLFFQMGCILMINDTIVLREEASQNIAQQSQQVKNQLEEEQGDIANSVEIEQAVQQIGIREKELQERAQSDITRAGVVSLGNIFIPGIGLMALGWLGLKGNR
jgi:hypothetical protein